MVRIQDFHSCHTGSSPVPNTIRELIDFNGVFLVSLFYFHKNIINSFICPNGGIGRHDGLKIH